MRGNFKMLEVKGAYIKPLKLFGAEPIKGAEKIKKVAEEAARYNFNFLLPLLNIELKYEPSLVKRNRFSGWRKNPLTLLIEESHKRDIEVYPWTTVFFEENKEEEENSLLPQTHPEWYTVTRAGESVEFKERGLDPAKEEVIEFILGNIKRLINNYDIDGISLDYIRYSGYRSKQPLNFTVEEWRESRVNNPYDVCYCDFCREDFKKRFGSDPKQLKANDPLFVEWERYGCEKVTDFLKRLNQEAKSIKPSLKISAYVFSKYAAVTNRQDWPTWVKKGYLDYINPTAYIYELNKFKERCKENKEVIDGRIPYYPTIGVRPLSGKLDAEGINARIDVLSQLGIKGAIFFTYSDLQPYLKDLDI